MRGRNSCVQYVCVVRCSNVTIIRNISSNILTKLTEFINRNCTQDVIKAIKTHLQPFWTFEPKNFYTTEIRHFLGHHVSGLSVKNHTLLSVRLRNITLLDTNLFEIFVKSIPIFLCSAMVRRFRYRRLWKITLVFEICWWFRQALS